MNISTALYKAFLKLIQISVSKKFLVFGISTSLLVFGYIPSEIWLPVALASLGIEGALDYTRRPPSEDNNVIPPSYG